MDSKYALERTAELHLRSVLKIKNTGIKLDNKLTELNTTIIEQSTKIKQLNDKITELEKTMLENAESIDALCDENDRKLDLLLNLTKS